ncbi:MAG TPA: hypothetical protein VGB79_12935 [Allosphingosinicella sp.]|jgi:hypothetical protein
MQWVIGEKHFLEIPQGIIDQLRESTRTLKEVVDIEQKFDILYSNFIELEQEIAQVTIRDAYRNVESVTDLFDAKETITRRVGNLLSSARLYVDQVKHHVSTLFPKDQLTKVEVSGYFSKEYDTRFGYRVMEALRNYSQHRGLPVHGMSHIASWLDGDRPTKRNEHNAALIISIDELKADGSIKSQIIEDLEAMEGTLDLKPFIREYIEGLASVHTQIRTLLQPIVARSEKMVSDTRKMFAEHAKLKSGPVGLVAGRIYKDGTAEEFFSLSDNSITYAAKLRTRTRSLQSLSKRTISTRNAFQV